MKLAQPQIPPKKRIVPARAWRKGGLGGIPPALQILGEICSNFFECTPPSSHRSGPILKHGRSPHNSSRQLICTGFLVKKKNIYQFEVSLAN